MKDTLRNRLICLLIGIAAISMFAVLLEAQQAYPGVGYNPAALGYTTSRWWAQDPVSGRLSQRSSGINFSARTSTSTDPSLWPPPVARADFDARWGAGAHTRKRWVGPDNELTRTVWEALAWAWGADRADLLGWTGPALLKRPGTGLPTWQETLDACATGHGTTIVQAYAVATWPGATKDRAVTIKDPRRPAGYFSEPNPYWPGVVTWYNNVVTTVPPIVPPITPPVTPPVSPKPRCGLLVYIPAQQIDWSPGLPSTGRIEIRYERIPPSAGQECEP